MKIYISNIKRVYKKRNRIIKIPFILKNPIVSVCDNNGEKINITYRIFEDKIILYSENYYKNICINVKQF